MRRRVLCGCWARLAFLRAREKKRKKAIQSFSHSVRVLLAKILQPSSAAAPRHRRVLLLVLLLPAVARKDLPPPSRAFSHGKRREHFCCRRRARAWIHRL